MGAANRRFTEAQNRLVAIFIDNPLRVVALDTKSTSKPIRKYTAAQTTSAHFDEYTIVGKLPTGGSGAKLYVAQTKQRIQPSCN